MPKVELTAEEKATAQQAYKLLSELSAAIVTLKKGFESFLRLVDETTVSQIVSENTTPVQNAIRANGYSKNFTWKQKTDYVIRVSGYPVTTSEIVAQLIALE